MNRTDLLRACLDARNRLVDSLVGELRISKATGELPPESLREAAAKGQIAHEASADLDRHLKGLSVVESVSPRRLPKQGRFNLGKWGADEDYRIYGDFLNGRKDADTAIQDLELRNAEIARDISGWIATHQEANPQWALNAGQWTTPPFGQGHVPEDELEKEIDNARAILRAIPAELERIIPSKPEAFQDVVVRSVRALWEHLELIRKGIGRDAPALPAIHEPLLTNTAVQSELRVAANWLDAVGRLRMGQQPFPNSDDNGTKPDRNENSERGKALGRRKRIPKDEADIRVRDWLLKNAKRVKKDPLGITRDEIADDTGVSTGGVSNSSPFRAFEAERKKRRKGPIRDIELSDGILAAMPSDAADPGEIAEVIELAKQLGCNEDEVSKQLRSVNASKLAELKESYEQQAKDRIEELTRHKRRHAPS